MSEDRNIYLRTVALAEALDLAKGAVDRAAILGVETVPAHEAAGRVTAAPVFARYSSPTFHAAAMDGIAVRAATTFAARAGRPLALRRGADYEPVNTGQPLPPGMDAVIMVEHVEQVDADTACIEAPAFPWSHVRRIGEDIVATELLLPRNHRLSPYDVGALLAAGIWEVAVRERVRIHCIPSGDEVLDFRDRPAPAPGEAVESNSQVLVSLAKGWTWGVEVVAGPPVADEPEALAAAVEAALDAGAHIVVLGAGSSAGSRDFSRAVFERVGRVLAHGIRVMPGKPTIVGAARGRLLVGAPGYPVSAVVCYEDVVAPLAAWLAHTVAPERPRARVRLARRTPSRLGLEERVRLAVGRVGGELSGAPLGRGAGMITTLTRAQAVLRIPENLEGREAGEVVEVDLLGAPSDVERVLMHVGSHDNTLDRIADRLMGLETPLVLVSAHVGSMGGLAALAQGTALFAGCHLFDPATGDFNFPFLERHLPGVDVTVINLAIRHQGLIVAPSNPKSIRGVADLARADVRFVNRQRGAGTRILLDHHLALAHIDPSAVRGYGDEEVTHMGVAVNVKTGAADCGLGILSAAAALELGFVPMARERYDLIIPAAALADARVAALLGIVRSPDFQAEIRAMGGYETTLTGRVMAPGMGLADG